MGEKKITRGDTVMLVLGSANRDPDVFPDPDTLNVTRLSNRHLAFGHGIHLCIGAALARMEGQVAIGALLRRLKHVELATDALDWRGDVAFRGVRRLPLAWSNY